MKCLFIAPLRYPFIASISAGMASCGMEVKEVDYQSFFGARTNQLYNGYRSLPRKIRNLWEVPYIRKVNVEYRRLFSEYRPDLVLIYNDQLIVPETLAEFAKTSRIAFFLGDNPLYTPTNIHNLSILFHSDLTICPDSFWCHQLSTMGLRNVVFDCFGINTSLYHPMDVRDSDKAEFSSDLIYVGSASKTNWGYKRTLFLSLFKDLDLRAYISGDGMERWYDLFPGLEQRIIKHDRFDVTFNNLVYNCSKVAPVEQVPSLFKGIHVRVFDTLGAGLLPLCEHSPDLKEVFHGIDIPMINDYREAAELATHWITADADRNGLVQQMRTRADERFAPRLVVQRMIDHLFKA